MANTHVPASPSGFYIVRTEKAGVFLTRVTDRRDNEADLADARRIHYWNGATECIGLASSGTSIPEDCRLTVPIASMTVLGVIEIIPCSQVAFDSLMAVRNWTA